MNNIIEGVKVYYDGSHFIAILPGYFKGKKKGKNKEYLVEVDGKVVDLKEAYNKANESNKGKKKKERTKAVSNEMEGFFANEAELEKFIEEQEARTFRNFVCRRKRLTYCLQTIFAHSLMIVQKSPQINLKRSLCKHSIICQPVKVGNM